MTDDHDWTRLARYFAGECTPDEAEEIRRLDPTSTGLGCLRRRPLPPEPRHKTWGDQVDVMNRIVRWFDDHLKDAGSRPGQTCPDPHLHGQAKKAETDRGTRRC